MNQPTVDDLARQIERLTTDEREELLSRILLMLVENQAEVDASWLAEAERRLDAIERGEDLPVPWDVVRSELGLK